MAKIFVVDDDPDMLALQSIPVIAITARGDMNENDFLQKGFAGMLQKP